MAIFRGGWYALPEEVRRGVEKVTGRVSEVDTVGWGAYWAVFARVRASRGVFFVRGSPAGSVTSCGESAVTAAVRLVSPRLLSETRGCGWHVVVSEGIVGHGARYAPGSGDLPVVREVLRMLARVSPAPMSDQVVPAEQRWAEFVADGDPGFLAGECLLHADWHPSSVLVSGGGAWLLEWPCPTRGAAWIDPACWALRLIAAGHSAVSAERQLQTVQAWREAPPDAVDRFAVAQHRWWHQSARRDPASPATRRMADAALVWARFRRVDHACEPRGAHHDYRHPALRRF